MSATRALVVGAAFVAAGAAVQEARARAVRRRISWAPGAGTLHDGSLHTRIIGDGAVGVLLLHGLGGSNAFWGSDYDTLAGAGRLIVPDLLGFGASPRPASGYTTGDHVAALTAVLEELGVSGPIVVGAHSTGCIIALALAEQRPDLVVGVVAFCPPLYPDEATARARLARVGMLERQLATDSPWAETMCRWACGHPRGAINIAAVVRPGLPPVLRHDSFQHTWASYAQTFRHVLAAAEGGRGLANVQVPVELVAGTDDAVTDLAYLQALADGLPHVTLTIRAGCDHDLPLAEPAAAVGALACASQLLLARSRDAQA